MPTAQPGTKTGNTGSGSGRQIGSKNPGGSGGRSIGMKAR